MCVLIYKPKGQKTPSRDTLEACCKANPHGFGYATMSGKFYKTMNSRDFIRSVIDNIGVEDEAMIHCRLATHGSQCVANCHPFASSENEIIFAHNGILPITPEGDMTDSETAFRRLFLPILIVHTMFDEEFEKAVSSIIGSSKFVFFNRVTKEARLFGDFADYQGCLFSNLRFMSYKRAYRHKASMIDWLY